MGKKRQCNKLVNMPLSKLFRNKLQASYSECVYIKKKTKKQPTVTSISLNSEYLVFALYSLMIGQNGFENYLHSIPTSSLKGL